MKAKGLLISIVLSSALGAWGGWYFQNFQKANLKAADYTPDTPAAQQPRSESSQLISLPELIANQIRTGVSRCPESDRVTYESCLLFQGSLGAWQRLGMPNQCPKIPQKPQIQDRKKYPALTPEHAIKASKSPCFAYLYAISVSNAVPILVSTANRAFQMGISDEFKKIGSDPEICLAARHGICGNHAAVGVAFFEKAGFPARPIEFYYLFNGERLSHITPEVMIDGKWRLIDTTYSAYWTSESFDSPFELLSSDELLSGSPALLSYNEALMPFGVSSILFQTNYFSYLSSKPDVIRGGTGEITLDLTSRAGSENFLHKPNFIGDNKSDGKTAGIQFRLTTKNYTYRLIVNISAAAISDSAQAFLCIDESCEEYSNDKRDYSFIVSRPSKLYLRTSSDVAYVVIKSLDWKVVSN
jgi:hypothetical protein